MRCQKRVLFARRCSSQTNTASSRRLPPRSASTAVTSTKQSVGWSIMLFCCVREGGYFAGRRGMRGDTRLWLGRAAGAAGAAPRATPAAPPAESSPFEDLFFYHTQNMITGVFTGVRAFSGLSQNFGIFRSLPEFRHFPALFFVFWCPSVQALRLIQRREKRERKKEIIVIKIIYKTWLPIVFAGFSGVSAFSGLCRNFGIFRSAMPECAPGGASAERSRRGGAVLAPAGGQSRTHATH